MLSIRIDKSVSGAYSSVLGGVGNNDLGLANAHIVGGGINAVLANTLHINALWANAIPNFPGGFGAAPGQIYWDAPGSPGMALYIG
jgi:hypothetical protein